MPSSLGHAMVAVAGGSAIAPRHLLKPFLIAGTVCAMAPDVDAVGRLWGGGDMEFIGGHRGFTHSIAFALLCGIALPLFTLGRGAWAGHRVRFGIFIAVSTLSHGLLDTLSSIGAAVDGVQFLYPWSTHRFTIERHLIHGPFTELAYVLLPLFALTRFVWYRRGFRWPDARRTHPTTLDLG